VVRLKAHCLCNTTRAATVVTTAKVGPTYCSDIDMGVGNRGLLEVLRVQVCAFELTYLNATLRGPETHFCRSPDNAPGDLIQDHHFFFFWEICQTPRPSPGSNRALVFNLGKILVQICNIDARESVLRLVEGA